MNTTQTCAVPLEMKFSRRSRVGFLLSIALISTLLFNGCVTFATIAAISGIVGALNSLGVFGDGQMSEFLGKAALIGCIVGLAGGLIWGWDTSVSSAMGLGGGESAGCEVATAGGAGGGVKDSKITWGKDGTGQFTRTNTSTTLTETTNVTSTPYTIKPGEATTKTTVKVVR